MSMTIRSELTEIAKELCRDLRKNATHAEKIFWRIVRNKKFQGRKFYRQYPLFYELNGCDSFFIADFCSFKDKIIIEIDGCAHDFRLSRDADRTIVLKSLGFRVIRFSNEEILYNIDGVLKILNQEINSGKTELTSRPPLLGREEG